MYLQHLEGLTALFMGLLTVERSREKVFFLMQVAESNGLGLFIDRYRDQIISPMHEWLLLTHQIKIRSQSRLSGASFRFNYELR